MDEDFKEKLAAVLNVHYGDDDNATSRTRSRSQSVTRIAFDEKLNEIFGQRKLAKVHQRDANTTAIHFRNKVLGLLDS